MISSNRKSVSFIKMYWMIIEGTMRFNMLGLKNLCSLKNIYFSFEI